MDKIWDRKFFEVGRHWPLWRGWKHRMTTQNRQKSTAKKITQTSIIVNSFISWTKNLKLLNNMDK